MLQDLKKITDKHGGEPGKGIADFRDAANLLLTRQFLYLEHERQARHYRLIVEFYEYFTELFDALGWQLYRDHDFGYVGVLPADDETHLILDLEHTLFLFITRLLFEEGVEARQTREGRVHISSEELLARYEAQTRRERPKVLAYRGILRLFQRHGLIRTGEDDPVTRLPQLALLPALRQIAGNRYLEQLEAHLQSDDDSDDESGIVEAPLASAETGEADQEDPIESAADTQPEKALTGQDLEESATPSSPTKRKRK